MSAGELAGSMIGQYYIDVEKGFDRMAGRVRIVTRTIGMPRWSPGSRGPASIAAWTGLARRGEGRSARTRIRR